MCVCVPLYDSASRIAYRICRYSHDYFSTWPYAASQIPDLGHAPTPEPHARRVPNMPITAQCCSCRDGGTSTLSAGSGGLRLDCRPFVGLLTLRPLRCQSTPITRLQSPDNFPFRVLRTDLTFLTPSTLPPVGQPIRNHAVRRACLFPSFPCVCFCTSSLVHYSHPSCLSSIAHARTRRRLHFPLSWPPCFGCCACMRDPSPPHHHTLLRPMGGANRACPSRIRSRPAFSNCIRSFVQLK